MIDHAEIKEIEDRIKECSRAMQAAAPEVAMAVTVIDFAKERRECLLARYAKKYIEEGLSDAAAKTKARAEKGYDEELNTLLGQYQDAQTTRKIDERWETSWETGRSLLARQRETLKKFPEE